MAPRAWIPAASGQSRTGRIALVCVGATCLGLGGCFQTLATALLAPEALAIEGAASGFESLTGGAEQSVANDFSRAVDDLNRILGANPEAENRPELEALRDSLSQHGQGNPAAAGPAAAPKGSLADDRERRSEADRRVTLEPGEESVVGDHIGLQPRGPLRRRGPERPEAFPDPSPIQPWDPRSYVMDLRPVRVR